MHVVQHRVDQKTKEEKKTRKPCLSVGVFLPRAIPSCLHFVGLFILEKTFSARSCQRGLVHIARAASASSSSRAGRAPFVVLPAHRLVLLQPKFYSNASRINLRAAASCLRHRYVASRACEYTALASRSLFGAQARPCYSFVYAP